MEEQSLWEPVRQQFAQQFGLHKVDVRAYSPLALAYLGDTVFDLIFRTIVVSQHNMAANKYHKKVCNYVSAVAQSEMVELLMDELTQEEMEIYKRGRNSKPYSKAKNASAMEYQRATGLECLVGYLYLSGQMERLLQLVQMAMERLEEHK
jgi:ribonuclease-3 family protein